MTDQKNNDLGANDEQLIDEKRMKDMAVAPGDPRDADTSQATREKGQAPTRADDDGMAQTPRDELEDADRDEENLNEGLEESMDASDPPSSIQP